MRNVPLILVLSASVAIAAHAQTDGIRLNQIGFYPLGQKVAVVADAAAESFFVLSAEAPDTVHAGSLQAAREWEPSAETVRIADFSALSTPGAYVLVVPGVGTSHPFRVSGDVHRDLGAGAIKAFYFQRASTALPSEHAGAWARTAGHPDDLVQVHPSAATPARPAGTIVAASKGWYDAGDYNKYIVNSGITMATLLSLYEDFPEHMATVRTNIPETGNGVPDLLDEVSWNLRWMLAMQDPEDGGIYTKLTTASFEGSVTPENARSQRYVVQKSTPAALNFAAVAAQSARIYAEFPDAYPGLADSCLSAAVAAWRWARENPDSLYRQGAMNARFDPDIETGGYGDRDVSDEFAWAAVELYATTAADSFLHAAELFGGDAMPVPSWNQVRPLAYYTLVRNSPLVHAAPAELATQARDRILALARMLADGAASSAYAVAMGTGRDFIWGSNSVAANQAIALIYAYRLSGEPHFLNAALANLDYILGRNATGYSFVTGFGAVTPMHPHHRPSESDAVAEPVPGLLAGGPNPGRQDRCDYPYTEPARSYVDDHCSYASNEIAINWNAPLAYLANAIEALQAAATRSE